MPQPYIGEIIIAGFNFAPADYAFCDGQLLPIAQNEALFALIGTTYGGDGQTTFALPDLRSRIPIGTGQGPGLNNYAIGEPGGVEGVTLTASQMAAHTHTVNATGLTATARASNAAGNQQSPAGGVFAVDASTPFSNATLTPGSDVIRAAHITELRARIDAYRGTLGLAPFAYTDPTITAGSTAVKAIHILDLRTALQQAYVSAGRTPPTYTDPALPAGAMAKAVHVTEIRNAVNAVASVPPTYNRSAPDAAMSPLAIGLAGGSTAMTGAIDPHDNRQPYLALNYCIALFGIFPSQA